MQAIRSELGLFGTTACLEAKSTDFSNSFDNVTPTFLNDIYLIELAKVPMKFTTLFELYLNFRS